MTKVFGYSAREEPDVYFVSVIQLELKAGKPVRPRQVQAGQDEVNVHLSGGNGDGTGDKGQCLGLGLGGMV